MRFKDRHEAGALVTAAIQDIVGGILIRALALPGFAMVVAAAGASGEWMSYQQEQLSTKFDSVRFLISASFLVWSCYFPSCSGASHL